MGLAALEQSLPGMCYLHSTAITSALLFVFVVKQQSLSLYVDVGILCKSAERESHQLPQIPLVGVHLPLGVCLRNVKLECKSFLMQFYAVLH